MGFLLLLVALLVIIGGIFGYNCGEESVRKEAARHGVAKYRVDEDGSSAFMWLIRKKGDN